MYETIAPKIFSMRILIRCMEVLGYWTRLYEFVDEHAGACLQQLQDLHPNLWLLQARIAKCSLNSYYSVRIPTIVFFLFIAPQKKYKKRKHFKYIKILYIFLLYLAILLQANLQRVLQYGEAFGKSGRQDARFVLLLIHYTETIFVY